MTSFAVLGPGGVGGLLAAALARAGSPVQVIARESTAASISDSGIRVHSAVLGDFVQAVPAAPTLAAPVDVLLVTPKATALAGSLERIGADPHLVIPLLNGFEHMSVLRCRFGGERVAAGTIRVEADRPEPGVVVQTGPAIRVEMAADDPRAAARLPPVADALIAAGIPAVIGPGEAQVLWSKLVRLVALACTTAAAGAPLGRIREDPSWRNRLMAVIDEAAAAARAEGAAIDPADTRAELEAAPAGLGSSMQRDIAAGRTPELDAIGGAVLRAARRHGLSCPVLEELCVEVAGRAGLAPPRSGPA